MPDDPQQKRLHDLEKHRDLLLEKLTRQQQALVLETRVEEQMRLERIIATDEATLQRVETELLSVRHQKRFAEANRLRRNQAYAKAIEVWREILLEEPSAHHLAHKEIKALEKRLEQKSRSDKLRQRLVQVKAVRPHFRDIAAALNQPADTASHDLLLQQIELLLDGVLDPDGFLLWWETERPASQEPPDVDITRLAQRVQQGEIVLFVGSGITSLYAETNSQGNALVSQLAQQIGYEQFRGTLSSIAEYYQLRPDFGPNKLLANLYAGLPHSGRKVALYQALAKVQTPLVLISSAYDDVLENVFRETGKPFVELASIVQPSPGDGYDIGHVVVSYSDGSRPIEALPEEALSGLRILEQGYSVIYKIRGTCEAADGNDPEETRMLRRDALTLAESSYFNFARHADRIIPGYVARQLRNRGFLFIGYRARDWEDRLLVRALLDKRRHAQEPCYVIGASPEPLEQAFWKSCQVEQHQMDVRELDRYLGEVGV